MATELITKVFLLSIVIAVVIKYGLGQLEIPASSGWALVGVLLPTLVMTMALLWRLKGGGGRNEA